ncbi:hypothetical protein MASR2M8_21080 [Opitutaceae bacterium]
MIDIFGMLGFVPDNSCVRTFFKIVAFLLSALWLPATQHCDLEAAAAELLAHDTHVGDHCQDACAQDVCGTVEGVSYTKNASALRALPPPESLLCACLVCLLVPVETLGETIIADPPEVQLLHRTWSFARRAALPARAPDRVA